VTVVPSEIPINQTLRDVLSKIPRRLDSPYVDQPPVIGPSCVNVFRSRE